MGEEESKCDNGKRQNKKSGPYSVNNPQGASSTYDISKQNIDEQDMSEKEDASTQQSVSDETDTSKDFDIETLADKAESLNILRFELDRLQLEFKARAYFENDIKPLTDTLYALSHASIHFSTTASNFASTNFGHSSKIKDALDLAEEVNEISEDLIEVLRCKMNNLLKFSKYDI